MQTSKFGILHPLAGALKKAMIASALASGLVPAVSLAAEGTFLVQLNEYEGYNTYFSIYLVDPEGRYVRTLWVSGDNPRWYRDQSRWWKYLGRNPQDLDAITGASTAPGDRAVIHINLEDEILDAGYQVRIDSIVEDQNNYPEDVQTPLSSENMKKKIPGTGYVRYFRYKWD